MAEYIVREAVLVPGAGGSTWRVTFALQRGDKEEIVVMIPPATLDEMFFADTYTLEQIETLRDDRA